MIPVQKDPKQLVLKAPTSWAHKKLAQKTFTNNFHKKLSQKTFTKNFHLFWKFIFPSRSFFRTELLSLTFSRRRSKKKLVQRQRGVCQICRGPTFFSKFGAETTLFMSKMRGAHKSGAHKLVQPIRPPGTHSLVLEKI